MNSIVKLENIEKIYKRGIEEIHALDNVNLDIAQGEFIAITGPSGSGKTTLLNIIGCMDNPDKGKVFIEENDITKKKEQYLVKIRKKTIGFVFQHFFLVPTLNVIENICIPKLFSKEKTDDELLMELLKITGLEKRAHHLPSQLSGGEMQRVAIARALINKPKILLADEPTGNLDSKLGLRIMELFSYLNEKGLTVLIVTHNHELVKKVKRNIVMEDGRIHA